MQELNSYEKKLQKEINDKLILCQTQTERSICKVYIEKDLLELGYTLNVYDCLQKGNK